MRKQPSLRTTQSASARERFLLFCAGVVPAMANLNRLSAPSTVMAFDEASPEQESERKVKGVVHVAMSDAQKQ
jgi:hypothetical protein